MLTEHEDWIRGKFATAEVQHEPFPHIFIRDILPTSVYEDMKEAMPSTFQFERAANADRIRNALTKPQWRIWRLRKKSPVEVHIIAGPHPYRFTEYSRDWDRRWGEHLSLVEQLTHERFGTHNAPWKSGQRILFYRPSGWSIRPHTHPTSEITNSMIYFPTEENTVEQGTLLYKPRNGAKLSHTEGTDEFGRDEVEPAAIIPYLPNALISWVNSPASVHGSIEIARGAPRRYVYFVSNTTD